MLGTLTKTLNDTLDATLRDFGAARARSRKNAIPAIFGPGGGGDPKRTFGSFLIAVRRGDHQALEAMGSRWADWEGGRDKAALTTQTGTQGGYTVPTTFLPELLDIAAENSIVEPRATRVPMAATSVEIPALDVTTAPSAGETAFFGGLTANWSEEAATITEEEPTFKQIRLTAHELTGYTLASNALLQDNAIGLEALLLQLFGRALGWYKDYAFLRGNGAGKPLGVLNSGALISVTRSAASAFALADAATMFSRLLPGWNPMQAVWAVHPTVLAKMFQIVSTSSGNALFLENVRDRPRMQLFGIPVQITEKLPSLNTLGDVLLLDLRHYLVGDRQDVEVAFSDHYRFINNQGTWRFVARCDGQPWLRSVVTLSDASSTLSPFVGLAAG
jgi:HK97 family phage major capsid protein